MKRLFCPLTAVCACGHASVCVCELDKKADNAHSLWLKNGHENKMETKPSEMRALFLVPSGLCFLETLLVLIFFFPYPMCLTLL